MTSLQSCPVAAPLTRDEYGELLNILLECERAGAMLLAAYAEDLPAGSRRRALLLQVQRDEARNCAVLIGLLRDAGILPTIATGRFFTKGLAIEGWSQRMAFLDRGQRGVADMLASALPRLGRHPGRGALHAMYESHVSNIALCKDAAD